MRASKREAALILAIETLALYADPHSYHAILLSFDRPCGWFADDQDFNKSYQRNMPGRAARKALFKIEKLVIRKKK